MLFTKVDITDVIDGNQYLIEDEYGCFVVARRYSDYSPMWASNGYHHAAVAIYAFPTNKG